VISIKRLAPYREDAAKMRPNYKALEQLRAQRAQRGAAPKVWHDKWKGKKEGEEGEGEGAEGVKAKERKRGREEENGGDAQPQEEQPQRQHKDSRKGSSGDKRAGISGGKRGWQHDGAGAGAAPPDTAEAKRQARLASFAKLTLRREDQVVPTRPAPPAAAAAAAGKGGSHQQQQQQPHKKQKRDGQQRQQGMGKVTVAAAGAQLTKAQKKNLRRQLKRQEKRVGAAE